MAAARIQRVRSSVCAFLFTESQTHRMVGVGRDLCGSSPTPLPKQGHLEQAAQDLVQAVLEYLQRRRLHNLPEQPVPCGWSLLIRVHQPAEGMVNLLIYFYSVDVDADKAIKRWSESSAVPLGEVSPA